MPLYGKLPGIVFGGFSSGDSFNIDYLSDSVKAMLCTSSYTPDQDNHTTKADVTSEVTGTGYTARGNAISSKTISYSSSTNVTTFSGAQVDWTSSTITARIAVIYKDTGTDNTSPLIGYFDFGSNQSSSSGTFSLVWNVAGIFTWTVT